MLLAARRRGDVRVIAVALRQHRIQLTAGLGVMVVLAALLVWTGHQMTSYLHSTGLAACLAAHGGGCDSFSRLFENRYRGLLGNIAYLNFLPMLVGVFWGARLVARELETGTYRLAWTQSITRRHWLTTKLALFVLATVAIAAGFSLLLAWWLHPFAQLSFGGGYSRMDEDAFGFQGMAPIAYSLFAFAAGAAAGVIVRRVLPAMAITFAIYLPLRLWVQSLRAGFAKPVEIRYQAFGTSPRAGLGDWVVQSRIVNGAGRTVSDQAVLSTCGIGPATPKHDVLGCLAAHGYQQLDVYQPASRFWAFQGIESAIFVGLATLLLALTFYWVTRRSTA
jgi:hypothetical protein